MKFDKHGLGEKYKRDIIDADLWSIKFARTQAEGVCSFQFPFRSLVKQKIEHRVHYGRFVVMLFEGAINFFH